MANDDEKKLLPGLDEDTFGDKTSVVQSDTFKMRVAEAGQAPPSLVLLVGPSNQVGRQWPIEDTDRIIGRNVSCHIYVDDRSVSKAHAKLVLKSGDVSIIDLESTNKTMLNGQMLKPLEPYSLNNNDQVKTGNVIFKFLEKGNIETVSVAQTFDRALTDPLTNIHNRGALIAKGVELFKKAQLLGVTVSYLVFDIDHFKRVNDTYGHPAGDYVLIELTKVVREKLIRENDFFARAGGEEFTLLLTGSAPKQVQEVAERIRHVIETHEFNYQGTPIPITISMGVAWLQDGDVNWEQAYERADQALYEAKNSGRNRVVTFSPPSAK